MSKKMLSTALALSVFALPMSFAFAAQQSHGGGHGAPATHMNHDAHGDAVSATAAAARASDSKVGTEVSSVANDKNKGKHEAHGHSKNTHGH